MKQKISLAYNENSVQGDVEADVLAEPLDAVKAEITTADAKPKKLNWRQKKKLKEQEAQAEAEKKLAEFKMLADTSFSGVIRILEGILIARVPKWRPMSEQEVSALSSSFIAVLLKYMPEDFNAAEEIALLLVIMGIVGSRVNELKAKND